MMNDEQRAAIIAKQQQTMFLGTIIHEGDGLTPETSTGWIALSDLTTAPTAQPFGLPAQRRDSIFVYTVIADRDESMFSQARKVIPAERVITITYEPAF